MNNIISQNKQKPLLSLCIPTRDRVEILKKTLESIYQDNSIDINLFEVIVSDNSPTDEINELKIFFQDKENLFFIKSDSIGFMNSINALENGNGVFLKLLNDYSYFFDNSFFDLITFFKSQVGKKNCISFTSSALNNNEIVYYSTFDSFLLNLSYFSSWSSAFCIRKEKFDSLKGVISYNNQFPHTSLLFEEYDSTGYVLNDIQYFKNQIVPKKGGTDLFHDFAVVYLNMLDVIQKNGIIQKQVFNNIKSDLFKKFLVEWYYNTKIKPNNYTYNVKNTKERILVHYSSKSYYKLLAFAYLLPFKSLLNYLNKKF